MNRHFPSGRFAYSLGYESYEAALEALYSMCAEGEMTMGEARIESYNASDSTRHRLTRYAITVA